jgi:hypothetical protein
VQVIRRMTPREGSGIVIAWRRLAAFCFAVLTTCTVTSCSPQPSPQPPDVERLRQALEQRPEAVSTVNVDFQEGSMSNSPYIDGRATLRDAASAEQVIDVVLAAARELRLESYKGVDGDFTFIRHRPDVPGDFSEFRLATFEQVPPDHTIAGQAREWIELANIYDNVAVGGLSSSGIYSKDVEIRFHILDRTRLEESLRSFPRVDFPDAAEWAWHVSNKSGTMRFTAEPGLPSEPVMRAMVSVLDAYIETGGTASGRVWAEWSSGHREGPDCLHVGVQIAAGKRDVIGAAYVDQLADSEVPHRIKVYGVGGVETGFEFDRCG